jgi:hypothetical protein
MKGIPRERLDPQYAMLASKLGRRRTESRSERLIEVRDPVLMPLPSVI